MTVTVLAALHEARKRLLETGTRNRLVHVNRANTRARVINARDDADSIYQLLRVDSRKLRFAAKGYDKEDANILLLDYHPEAPTKKKARTLETPIGPKLLARRLRDLFNDNRTAEEERGVSVLYLALGFLNWLEEPSTVREAPLILLPVALKENKRGTMELVVRDDELITNLPLQARLVEDFKLHLPDIDEVEGWTPGAYFDGVENLVRDKAGWAVDRTGLQLGLFSFAKFLMLRDLDPANWPKGMLEEHPLLKAVLTDGFDEEASRFDEECNLDTLFSPQDLAHVVDADASQTKVIEDVRQGSNLLVQGPPGTGKSQTIVNILASAVQDGKTVLFMTEKMAALSVVHSRMKQVGLGDLCLELHSNKTKRQPFWQEIAKTIRASATATPKEVDSTSLYASRNRLNELNENMHSSITGCDYTPYEVLADLVHFLGQGIESPRISQIELARLSSVDVTTRIFAIEAFADQVTFTGPVTQHAFHGSRNCGLEPPDLERLKQDLANALEALVCLQKTVSDVASVSNTFEHASRYTQAAELLTQPPEGLKEFGAALWDARGQVRLGEALEAAAAWQKIEVHLREEFMDNAVEAQVQTLFATLKKGVESWLARQGIAYRRARSGLAEILKGDLPEDLEARVHLAEKLMAGQEAYHAFTEEAHYLQQGLGPHWRGLRTEFDRIKTVADWLYKLEATGLCPSWEVLEAGPQTAAVPADTLRKQMEAAKEAVTTVCGRLDIDLVAAFEQADLSKIPLNILHNHFIRMQEQRGTYRAWVERVQAAKALTDLGLDDLRALVDQETIAPQNTLIEFRYALAEARWRYALEHTPALGTMRAANRHALVAGFAELEEKHFHETRSGVRSRHLAQVPRGKVGTMRTIRSEIGRKTRHRALRKVFGECHEMLQRIKPVWLMSPISLAQFAPPGSLNFDLLVIDEASQVRPEDAFGAVARARQLVVVGDQKQLPPTQFFERIANDDDEVPPAAQALEMESILTLCEARAIPQRLLEWHYRSRDPSLVALSNRQFYDNRLIVPPSPRRNHRQTGLSFERVAGVYARGREASGDQGTNRIEAEALAQALASHAQDSPHLSLGIVAFSKVQTTLIEETIRVACNDNPTLEAYVCGGAPEPVFVKSIETVQGDERDVILISVGYGPGEAGGRLTAMNFGPINTEGGERRLNVLFTRARVQCRVFCSFDPGDIDNTRTSKEGPAMLRAYLRDAQAGDDSPLPTRDCAACAVASDVGRAIEALGYAVDFDIGTETFTIDLGVRSKGDENRYLLAIECDGPRYHDSAWARERDRLRTATLRQMGWHTHRIWSLDWYYDRDYELKRLQEALEARLVASEDDPVVLPTVRHHDGAVQDEKSVDLSAITLNLPPYEMADITVPAQPANLAIDVLAQVAAQIIDIEGPIQAQELIRRISSLSNSQRVTKSLADAVTAALELVPPGYEADDEGFWSTAAQRATPPMRDRSDLLSSLRQAELLSSLEIQATIQLLRTECGVLNAEETVRETARLLGFARPGAKLTSRIKEGL